MGKPRSEIRPFISITAFGAWLLAVLIPLLSATAASAGPLDGLAAPVKEVTAPVTEVVETVVPPPVTSPAPPAVEIPPVKVPTPPTHSAPAPEAVPATSTVAETAKHVTGAATETVTKAAGTVATTGEAVTGAVGTVAGAPRQATSSATPEPGTASGAATKGAQSTGANGSAGAGASATNEAETAGGRGAWSAPADVVEPPGSMPARLLDPFIHVWPAIALTAERALGDFVRHWSRSLLALLEENGTGSLRGEGSGFAITGTAATTPAAHASGQPPFSWFSPSSIPPFNWISDEDALPVLVFLLVLAATALMFLVLSRRELNEPVLPRRFRRWRHHRSRSIR